MNVPDRIPLVGNVPIIGQEDGGLLRRQMFREVKERMSSALFGRRKMVCKDCKDANRFRAFRSWDGLRTHLIEYHKIDRREVPE